MMHRLNGSRHNLVRASLGISLAIFTVFSPASAATPAGPTTLAVNSASPSASIKPGDEVPRIPAGTPARSASDNLARIASMSTAVAEIDRLVEADYKANSVTPNAPATDEQFLRRVYLDVAGRIPTFEEARDFLASTDPAKRAHLIDKLLDSPAFVSNMYNFYADLLRVQTRPQGKVPGADYIDWVKQSIAENKPYDQFVYQMLTAKGQPFEDGATGYMLRDSGMPLDNMSNTVRIFLGTQIGCAQCHDHPFEKWTQREFYSLAAYTAGTDTRTRPDNVGGLKKLVAKEQDKDVQKIVQRIIQVSSYGVTDTPKKVLHLPDDYKYKDAKPKDPVSPATIFGGDANITGSDVPREVFAKWLTARDNPRFAPVIANRLWKRLMGVGLFEPVDDITDDTKAANQPLMAYLAHYMLDINFDTKHYLRTVLNTKMYQRQSSREEPKKAEPYRFAGPALRRMSAEQVWDSLLTLIVPDLDTRSGAALGYAVGKTPLPEIDIRGKTPEQIIAIAKEMIAKKGEMKQDMKQEIKKQFVGDSDGKYRGIPGMFVRASEGPSPAPAGSFLRQFGQSDREVVDGAEREATVMQALAMLNGPLIQQGVLNKQGMLARHIDAAATPDQKFDVVFLSILSRKPTEHDRFIASEELRRNPAAAYQNIAWSLVNTREFIFVQ